MILNVRWIRFGSFFDSKTRVLRVLGATGKSYQALPGPTTLTQLSNDDSGHLEALCLPSACHRCHRSPLLRATARSSEIESTEPPKAAEIHGLYQE